MSFWTIISNFFGAIKNVFGFLLFRSKQNNRPEIIDNRERKEEQKLIDETNQAIKNRDVNKIRDGLAIFLLFCGLNLFGNDGLMGNPNGLDKLTPSLMRGLVAYWKLDEASGTRTNAAATGGGTFNLTDVNSGGSVAGKIGLAWTNTVDSRLDGKTNNYFTNGFTVSFWVYCLSAGQSSYPCPVSKAYNTVTNRQTFQIFTAHASYTNKGITSVSLNSGNYVTLLSGVDFRDNKWTHHVITASTDSGYLSWYTNGVLVAATNGVTSIQHSNAKFMIGGLENATYATYLRGAIDECGLWDREITQSEITQLYNATKARRFPFNSGP